MESINKSQVSKLSQVAFFAQFSKYFLVTGSLSSKAIKFMSSLYNSLIAEFCLGVGGRAGFLDNMLKSRRSPFFYFTFRPIKIKQVIF